MNIDTFFTQGTTHKVNQDYALSCFNHNENKAAIIVCDGCSSAEVQVGSRRINNTDTGVRLLARAAAKHIFQDNIGLDKMFQRILATANGFRAALSLERESMYATLLVAYADDALIHVHCVGDGAVALRERDTGDIRFFELSFPNGAPYYLQYEYDDGSRDLYQANCGEANYEIQESLLKADDTIEVRGTQRSRVPLDSSAIGGMGYFTFDLMEYRSKYDMVALISDGISNFIRRMDGATSRISERVDALDVAEHLLRFKGFNGAFVERRCTRAMLEFENLGWQNTDDLSVAAMYLPELAEVTQ